jgi:hypothetical protein
MGNPSEPQFDIKILEQFALCPTCNQRYQRFYYNNSLGRSNESYDIYYPCGLNINVEPWYTPYKVLKYGLCKESKNYKEIKSDYDKVIETFKETFVDAIINSNILKKNFELIVKQFKEDINSINDDIVNRFNSKIKMQSLMETLIK